MSSQTQTNGTTPEIDVERIVQTELSRRALANRENGAKSKGPTTEEGKSRSSQNALKHGLYAKKKVVIPLDEEEEFEPYQTAMIAHFQPTDPFQANLVDRIIMCSWRLRRVITLESLFLGPSRSPSRFPQTAFSTINDSNQLINLTKYESALERSLYQALTTLTLLKSESAAKPKIDETNPI